jgi:protein transport protein SEC24
VTFQPAGIDLTLGVAHADTAFAFELSHSTKLDVREHAHIQVALLYTSATTGQRRVRVLNLAIQVADLAGNVFKFADMDAVVAVMAKRGEIPMSFLCRQPDFDAY